LTITNHRNSPSNSEFGLQISENSPLYKPGAAAHIPPPMTFAAIPWLSISINILLVIFVIVCLLMSLLILMQRPKQEGLGAAFGGGVTDQVFGARTTNVLQKGTVYLGSMFFIISLALAVLMGQQTKTVTLSAPETAAKVEEAPPTEPAVEALPKSLSEELPAEDQAATATPAPAEVPADASSEETPAIEPTPAPVETPAPAETPAEETPAAAGDGPTEP
jgi:preprotein translocase subunit SecG